MKFKSITIRAALILVIIAIVVGTTWDFFFQLKSTLTSETFRTLSDVSTDYNKAFLEHIEYNKRMLKVLAGNIEDMKSLPKESITRMMKNAVLNGEFTKIVMCDKNGISYSNEGITVDVSHREYFKKAMQGETCVSEPIVSIVSGEREIVIAVPIFSGKAITGVIFGVYPLSTTGEQLLDFTYYSDGYGFIVASDGTIIISSEHKDKLAYEENIYNFFEKVNFEKFSLDELKANVKNGESNNFIYTYNGKKRFVSFLPSTVNDWYTFSIGSDSLIKSQEQATNRIVLNMILKLFLMALFILAWIVLSNIRHNKQIRKANHKYQSLLDNINGGMIVASHGESQNDIIVSYVSSGFTEMTGYTLEDIQTIFNGNYLHVILREDIEWAFEQHLKQLKSGNTYHIPYRIRKKDNSVIWVMDNGFLVTDGDKLNNHSIITDITMIKQQEEELRLSEERFSIAINASSGTLFEVDLKSQRYTHFENPQRIFGVSVEKLFADTNEFSGLPYEEYIDKITEYFFHPDDISIAKKAMERVMETKKASYEARLKGINNTYVWAKIDLSVVPDEFGKPLRLIGYMSDINDIKKQAEILENKVQTDPMTGLYNKVAMATLANKTLKDIPKGLHALIVLDIDNFKGINDTLGHAFGDVVLIEVCTKLRSLFRGADILGRMGGDEFAILMRSVPDTSSVLKKAAEISKAFRQTYAGKKEDYKVSCSMGIIIISDISENNDSFESLYRKADSALYQAKRNGKDQFVLYCEEDAPNYPIESTRLNDEEMHFQRIHHNTEEYIFELMYASTDFNISINRAIAAIGQQYHVSRVAIFENDEDNQRANIIYEWCNEGVLSLIENASHMEISADGESIFDCFDDDGVLYCNDINQLPSYSRQILQAKGVISTLKIIIRNDEKICGFVGFDECDNQRIWTSEEIEKLSFMAKVISVFLFKKKTETALIENLNTRLKILDILPDYICVVNPETHSIVYANNRIKELIPNVQTGAFCFSTLRGGQNAPCQICLVERIKRGDINNLEIISDDKKTRLKIKAISINWTNNQKMVLLYGTTVIKEIQ